MRECREFIDFLLTTEYFFSDMIVVINLSYQLDEIWNDHQRMFMAGYPTVSDITRQAGIFDYMKKGRL